jgi:hypothetical protein
VVGRWRGGIISGEEGSRWGKGTEDILNLVGKVCSWHQEEYTGTRKFTSLRSLCEGQCCDTEGECPERLSLGSHKASRKRRLLTFHVLYRLVDIHLSHEVMQPVKPFVRVWVLVCEDKPVVAFPQLPLVYRQPSKSAHRVIQIRDTHLPHRSMRRDTMTG